MLICFRFGCCDAQCFVAVGGCRLGMIGMMNVVVVIVDGV